MVFNKPHCLQVDFILHGKWNFSQEEWTSGRVAPERLRGVLSLAGSAVSDLEYELQQAVENGDLSEQEALRMLEQKVHPLEVRKLRTPDINEAFRIFQKFSGDAQAQEGFYKTLLGYITTVVKSSSKDGSTFSNIEDAISTSAMKVWRSLRKFDPGRSSFARFITVVTQSEIRRHLDSYEVGRVPLEAVETLPASELPSAPMPVDKQILLKEVVEGLDPEDRTVVQMVLDGLTQTEIAEALGVTQQAISKRFIRLQKVVKFLF